MKTLIPSIFIYSLVRTREGAQGYSTYNLGIRNFSSKKSHIGKVIGCSSTSSSTPYNLYTIELLEGKKITTMRREDIIAINEEEYAVAEIMEE